MTASREDGYIVLSLLGVPNKKEKFIVVVYSSWINDDFVSYPIIKEDDEDDKHLLRDFLKQKTQKAPAEWPKYKFTRLNSLVYGIDKYRFFYLYKYFV